MTLGWHGASLKNSIMNSMAMQRRLSLKQVVNSRTKVHRQSFSNE